MLEFLSQPWPWYVAGPLLGLMVPTLLLIGGKHLGISNNFRHACTAVMPGDINFFRYNWKQDGLWNLIFAAGILLGAVVAANFLGSGNPLPVSDATIADLAALGIMDTTGLVPKQVFSLEGLMTLRGFLMMTVGGFLVGFGARYSGGCTSGHAIFGMANLQLPSLIAVIGFFAGMEAQVVADLRAVERGGQPERRVAIGEREEIGRRGPRDCAGPHRCAGQRHNAAGMAEGVQHPAEKALGVVRRVGETWRKGTRGAAHVPASRATVKNSTFVAAARAAIRRWRASASRASGATISASSRSRQSSRWPPKPTPPVSTPPT